MTDARGAIKMGTGTHGTLRRAITRHGAQSWVYTKKTTGYICVAVRLIKKYI